MEHALITESGACCLSTSTSRADRRTLRLGTRQNSSAYIYVCCAYLLQFPSILLLLLNPVQIVSSGPALRLIQS